MAYQVRYTDSTNLNKPAITVEDNTIDASTSIQFPGRNTSGYGTIIAENFLHMLENFANNSEPVNPIEGQLWYDNTEGVNQLKVYDGTTWNSAGGLKKGNAEPELAASLPGDLWVNTDTQQLYLYTGSGWILVGPRFSSGARTGAEPEFIEDILSNEQAVVSNYVNGERIAIISSVEFEPKTLIPGFPYIRQGVTLNANYNTYYGVAQQASALLVGTTTVNASNFLRSDVTSSTNFPINVRNSAGIGIGEDTELNLSVDGAAGVIFHKTSGSNLDIRMNNNGAIRTVVKIDSTEKVGINNTNPQADLDVGGDIIASGNINVTSSTLSTSTTTGSGVFTGGVGIGGNLNVGGDVSLGGTVTIVDEIVPDVDLGANIGSNERKFQRIWSSRFDGVLYGDLYGTVYGNATGSSTKLASPTIFDLDGDITSNEVEFDGQTQTPTLNTTSASGTGTTVRLTFEAQTVAPYPAGSTIVVSGIAPVGYRGTYVVTDGGLDYVEYDGVTTGAQTSVGSVSLFGQSGNRKRFYTQLSETFIADKDEVESIGDGDEFVVSRGAEGLKKITKANLWNAIPATPAGVMMPYAGASSPEGWLLCDGSEVLISQYPTLFDAIGYAFGDENLLNGLGTFKLPDMRGRMALGADNMNNNITVPSALDPTNQIATGGGSADRVTDPEADSVGLSNGQEAIDLEVSQVPNHKHDMQGTTPDGLTKNQYYAYRNVPGDPSDVGSIGGQGSTDVGLGQYLSNSGEIENYSTQDPVNLMNPYLTLNYIIYTGQG
jgi:microcystin-dependent protein